MKRSASRSPKIWVFNFDILAQNYVRLYWPGTYFFVQALSVIVESTSALDDDPFAIGRFFAAIARAEEFVLSPLGYTYQALKAGVEDEARARTVSDRIFPQIAIFLALAKNFSSSLEPITTREIIYGWDSLQIPDKQSGFSDNSASKTPAADKISERMLTVAFPLAQEPTPTSDIAEAIVLTLAIVPKTHVDAPGLFIGVGGDGSVEFPVSDRWKFAIEASAKPAVSLLLKAEDWDMSASVQNPVDAPLNVAFVSIPDETDVTYAFPHRDETRIEMGQLSLSFRFDGTQGGIKAEARRCAVVIAAKDQDGFLAEFLPKEGLRVPFNFGVGFSTEQGFFTEGNIPLLSGHSSGAPAKLASLMANTSAVSTSDESAQEMAKLSGTQQPELGTQQIIAIGKTFLGVTLKHLMLGLLPSSDPAHAEAKVEVSVALEIELGPVVATVDRIGFQTGLAFPESGGNMGFADLELGFKPPSGIGLKIDATVVSGGGFLFFDSERGQYAGVVQLNLEGGITLTAIGLISTRLPNGAKGFSLVVMITAEDFVPIALGLGFTLTGIGGLLAINRTCNETFLREGIKNQTLDHLLFPKDPIRNAAQILGILNAAFPPRDGSYLFGPALQICWGTPPVLKMDLGLILELGNRKRLIVLGKISAILPNERESLIRLQMNALGIVDFDRGTIALDAVLYDSRLLNQFPLTGSMAMRLNWSGSPSFALAIGGFHPAFRPPSGFPALQRIALSLSDTQDFRLRCDAYFALTSNTLQFGSHAELFVRARGFSLIGQIGFDVLIQFDPFGFLASFYASVQLKRGSTNLFKVKVEGELAGPRPLHIRGKATFEIFWCSFSVGFDATLVEGQPPPKLAPVNVMEQLVVALNDSRNWGGQLAEGERRLVTLRETRPTDQITLHPLGQLAVSQKVVPLDLEIAKFGNATPADGRLFKINGLSINDKTVSLERLTKLTELFAPSQFLALTDDEKLAAPSFEAMKAGIRVGTDSVVLPGNDADIIEDDAIAFETIVLDKTNNQPPPAEQFVITPGLLSQQMSFGAAARSEVRRTGTAKYHLTDSKYALAKKGWSLAAIADGSPQAVPGIEAGKVATYAESFQALARLKQQAPARAQGLMLIRQVRQSTES